MERVLKPQFIFVPGASSYSLRRVFSGRGGNGAVSRVGIHHSAIGSMAEKADGMSYFVPDDARAAAARVQFDSRLGKAPAAIPVCMGVPARHRIVNNHLNGGSRPRNDKGEFSAQGAVPVVYDALGIDARRVINGNGRVRPPDGLSAVPIGVVLPNVPENRVVSGRHRLRRRLGGITELSAGRQARGDERQRYGDNAVVQNIKNPRRSFHLRLPFPASSRAGTAEFELKN